MRPFSSILVLALMMPSLMMVHAQPTSEKEEDWDLPDLPEDLQLGMEKLDVDCGEDGECFWGEFCFPMCDKVEVDTCGTGAVCCDCSMDSESNDEDD